MKLNKIFLPALLGLTATALLPSCSDETGIFAPDPEPQEGVVLRLPDFEGAVEFARSRAGETSASSELEGTLQSLWLFVFEKNGDDWKLVTTDYPKNLKDENTINGKLSSSEEGYKDYSLTLPAGEFRFYLLANLDDYGISESDIKAIKKIEGTSGETGIKDLTLTFSGPLTNGHLPMACMSVVGTNKNPTQADQSISIAAGESKTIYADLSFLCAKVRYTVLFDNSENGISQDFGSKVAKFDNVSIGNIISKTQINSELTNFANAGGVTGNPEIQLTKYTYPDASYPENSEADDLLTTSTKAGTYALQGIVYLPENVSDKKTTLNLTGGCYASSADTQAIYPIQKTTTLCPSDVNGGKFSRGNFYDIVVKVISYDALDLTATVNTWEPKELTYTLTGKPYEFIVDRTTLEKVTTGEETKIVYKADLGVSYESPILKDEDITGTFSEKAKGLELYQINIVNDSVFVQVNGDIPFSDLQKINNLSDQNKKEKYQYFHLKSGRLNKRIDVTDLDLSPFFEVSPKTIILDVREIISSGEDEPSFKITYKTNVDDATITIGNGEGTSTTDISNLIGTGIGSALTLKHDDGVSINSNKQLGKIDGKLALTGHGIMNGNSFWSSNHEYNITLTNSGINTEERTKKIKIIVKPYNSDYIIHFKDNTKGWGAPHIYVYQCLELPQDKANGATVGYRDGTDNLAALEYAFTNDLSFKGWDGHGGDVPIGSITDTDDGFVFVGGKGTPDNLKFKPGNTSTNYYNDVDHNEIHKENLKRNSKGWICLQCKEEKYKVSNGGRTYPGIVMEYEGNGWWKYVLTGVATPGKAMIMFSDGHLGEQTGSKYRYPDHSKVGVPLFDFPDNEGWFLYEGEVDGSYSFTDDRPTSKEKTVPDVAYYNYKFYWPGNNNQNMKYRYIKWGDDDKGNSVTWDVNTTSEGTWEYYEFGYRDHGTNDIAYSIGNGSNTLTGGTHVLYDLNAFIEEDDGYYYGYITLEDNNVFGGKPSWTPSSTHPHYLYFQDQSGQYVNDPRVHYFKDNGTKTWKNWNDPVTKMEPIKRCPIKYEDNNKSIGKWYRFIIPSEYEGQQFVVHNNGGLPQSDKSQTDGNPNIGGYNLSYGNCSIVLYWDKSYTDRGWAFKWQY